NYSTGTAFAGYFNSDLCYAYHYAEAEANRYFYPVVAASNRSCAGKSGGTPSQRLWSGNFLNWAAMQAVDTFRLALTGGYRVHRPADGTPPSVTITGSNGSSVTKATSEMPGITYLEKGNSDRFETGYTPLRRIDNSSTLVAGATPALTSGFRTRIGGVRNQMWFTLTNNGSLGSSQSWNDPKALPLPLPNGIQGAPGDSELSAVPYNPASHSLPDSSTSCPGSSYKKSTALCSNGNTPSSYGKDATYTVSIRVQVCDGTLDTR